MDNPGVIGFPPLIWLVNAVISVLVHLLIRLPIMRYSICLPCGIVFIVLAPTLALSALRTMKAAGTNVHPSEPALALVHGGPFRFTRNPMYLANTLLLIGVSFITGIGWFLLFAFLAAFATQKLAIEKEEKMLTAKFGKKYRDYAKRVRRWI